MNPKRPSGSVRYENQGRVVIVTGGCSGIGRAICDAFAQSEAMVICADVDDASAADLPDGIDYVHCDVASEADCKTVATHAVNHHGGIDVLVNNAAIQPKSSYAPIHQLDSDTWRQMLAVNLSGYHWMAKHVVPVMLQQRSGVIVNLASGQAHRTAREVGTYGPIKAANVMQTRQWGIEYARHGIRVVSVSPGAIDTPLVRATLQQQGGGDALANRHPLGRIGQTAEVAAAVLWLSSNDASFVTATDLEVDGGLGGFGAFADPYSQD
ncbi:2,5-dichloro-2,5-cyclohexadiene-1,4-diol dehydrogenase [Stieleria maiorica]|uniref:2,5-dichloro-2,5-cyclohexadiene-1,4-diol dehydrogenase n=1 Tax=Stieleria maiorica TaxID=2795974 RepID=A0A5B9MFC6_9BACT|nr:SDR family oxidoreductase [Stieleria maiorica]QEF98265.1 2,5-dichloro-2,5-cyclohexadiene-1,4-diol dehydrogenase [Stieleria maiorica]